MSWYRRRRYSTAYRGFPPYVSVAERKEAAQRKITKLKKKGNEVNPVIINGRMIAKTFWGKAWCDHLESYSDYENRLPRGRTYVRNGSVVDLKILAGEIKALVSGSSMYEVKVMVAPILVKKWQAIVKQCVGKVTSLIELLQGKFSSGVMEVITCSENGLFPSFEEIELNCSCPDYASMCKHVAAVLYGVGARLDLQPDALFLLRKADHTELLTSASGSILAKATTAQGVDVLADGDLSTLFDIDIEELTPKPVVKPKRSAVKKPLPKKAKSTKPVLKKPRTIKKQVKAPTRVKLAVKAKKAVQKKTPSRTKLY